MAGKTIEDTGHVLMKGEFFHPVRWTDVTLLGPEVEQRENAVRLYRSSPERWTLQIRAHRNGRPKGQFFMANASLALDDLKALREATDVLIAKLDNPDSGV